MFKRWWCVLLVMAGIGPVLGLLTAAVVTYVTPRQYECRAVIEVKPMVPRMVVFGGNTREVSGFPMPEADNPTSAVRWFFGSRSLRLR